MPKASYAATTPTANRRLKAVPAPTPTVLRFSRYPLCPTYDVETAYGLIRAFGGFDVVAAEYSCFTGDGAQRVEGWAVTGNIPTGWHLRMFARACAMGLTVNPSVFGFPDGDDAGQALAYLMHDAHLARAGGTDA